MKKNVFKFKSNYKKIVSVEVTHSYFVNRVFDRFKIKPNSFSQSVMKNYGIIFRKTQVGFVLLYQENERFKGKTFNGEFTLHFDLTFLDENFLSYTNIRYKEGQKIILNNSSEKIKKQNTKIQLHKNEFVDKECIVENDEGILTAEIIIKLNSKNEYFGTESLNKNSIEKNYIIKFDSRLVNIRYNFITDIKSKDFKKYFIRDNERLDSNESLDSSNENSDPNEKFYSRKLSNGKNVYCINKKDQIKISDNYNFDEILKKDDKLYNSFELPLPNPDKKNISYNSQKNIFYADVFINLN